MTAFTRVGSEVWSWMSGWPIESKMLWFALFTSPQARRCVPGLWHGGVHAMAEASYMPYDVTWNALQNLIALEVVEFDTRHNVLRMRELPDAGEYPDNGNVIASWWTRFKSIPDCEMRNAHVRTLWWLVETGATRAGKAVTPHHRSAWNKTFGTVSVPEERRRGVRSLAESDTSTRVQPSLFPSAAPDSGTVYRTVSDTVPGTVPVDNSDSLHQTNKKDHLETVPGTVRIPDLGSRIPDHSSLIPERGIGGGHESGRPKLALVPPFLVQDVIEKLSAGLWDSQFDKTHSPAISAMIPDWVGVGVRAEDFDFLARFSRISGEPISMRWLAGCDIRKEIAKARRTVEWREAQASAAAQDST